MAQDWRARLYAESKTVECAAAQHRGRCVTVFYGSCLVYGDAIFCFFRSCTRESAWCHRLNFKFHQESNSV